jgi:hypothetical protein
MLVRLDYRRDRAKYQLVWFDPYTGLRCTQIVGADEAVAKEAAAVLESKLAEIPTARRKQNVHRYRVKRFA